MTISETQAKALSIIVAHGSEITRPADFAGFMWPDSECWTNRTSCGYGTSIGGGMPLAAGGYLGKLEKAGLVRWHSGKGEYDRKWTLTDKGEQELKNYTCPPNAELRGAHDEA